MRRMIVHAAVGLALSAAPALSHSGGLNAEGCHNNRKTGDYHCHRSASRSAPSPSRLLNVPSGGGVSFTTCSQARAAGYSRMQRGEAGYARRLDRDNDGVACE
jgi:hypothetical protein